MSYYGDFYEGDFIIDNTTLHLRISTHPATNVRMGNHPSDDKISIVILKNGEHKDVGMHDGYTEYIYHPEKVSPQDAANAVIKGVLNLIENGEFVDETGKAEKHPYPYEDENGVLRYRDDRKYAGRREWAAKNHAKNKEIGIAAGMTDAQTGLIERLASLRHELHTSQNSIITDNSDILQRLVALNAEMYDEGMYMNFIPTDEVDYIDIDTIDVAYAVAEIEGSAPERGTEEFREWYDDVYAEAYRELEKLNSQIEEFLGEIGRTCKTLCLCVDVG